MTARSKLTEDLFDRLPTGAAVFDRDLRLRSCNPAWDVQVPAEITAVLEPLLTRALEGGAIHRETLRVEVSGSISYWDVALNPIPEGLIVTASEVTEQETVLASLRESDGHLRSLLENATNFIVYRIAVDEANPYGARVLLVSPSIREIIGISDPYRFESWFECIHPDDVPMAVEANRRAIQDGRPYRQAVRVYHSRKEAWIWVYTASTPVFDTEGKLTHFNGLILDITEQKQAEKAVQQAYQTLEARIEARTRELQTILAVTAAASSSLDLDEMLRASLDRLVTLVGASRAGVLLLDPETGELEPRMLRPDIPLSPDDLAEIIPACSSVLLRGEALYIPVDEAAGFLEPGALLPLRVRGQATGVLTIIGPPGGAFSQEEQALFESIADQLGVAIENARLFEQAERSAVIAERNRLARDLHDAVTQTLFSASIIAEVLPRLWKRDPEEGQRRLDELRQLTRGALAEMRTLLLELRPTALAEAEMGELLRHLSEAFTGRTRIPIDLATGGDYALSPDVKVALYRIVQEALNNVGKHAAAQQVWLNLDCQPQQVRLVVRDDGRGFNPESVPPECLGLGIMRERAEAIGAELTIESQTGQGTRVLVAWSVG
jgi:PAS domain S-box-containing protein